MTMPVGKTVKLMSALALAAALSACGTNGAPNQLANANAVNAHDMNRAPAGYRILLASSQYKPLVNGVNPFFGR